MITVGSDMESLLSEGQVLAVTDWQSRELSSPEKRPFELKWYAKDADFRTNNQQKLAAREDGLQAFAILTLLEQIAAKSPIRGLLLDEDGPLHSRDLARKTRFPQHEFDAGIPTLLQEGLLEIKNLKPSACDQDEFKNSADRIDEDSRQTDRQETNSVTREHNRHTQRAPTSQPHSSALTQPTQAEICKALESLSHLTCCQMVRFLINGSPTKTATNTVERLIISMPDEVVEQTCGAIRALCIKNDLPRDRQAKLLTASLKKAAAKKSDKIPFDENTFNRVANSKRS
jgi:hypothetical protein